MGFGGDQTVTQKTELDPVQQLYLYGSHGLDQDFLDEYRAGIERKNQFRAGMPMPVSSPQDSSSSGSSMDYGGILTGGGPGGAISMFRNGGLASLPANGMRPPIMPNLGNRDNAYNVAMMARQRYQMGGMIQGPGTGTSDSIPARIYQNGQPVSEARLSDGEVVLSRKDLANMDPAGNADRAANMVGNAKNGTRGEAAARMYQMAQQLRNGGRVR